MIVLQPIVILLLITFSSIYVVESQLSTTPVTSKKSTTKKIVKTNSSETTSEPGKLTSVSPENLNDAEILAEEIKNEVFVNNLLTTPNESAVVVFPELRHGPEYDLDWTFTDKDTIRVTFDLYSLPKSLIDLSKKPKSNGEKLNILATMVSIPSRSVKSIFSLQYFLFIIRPYKSNKEIILKMEKLHPKESPLKNFTFFSNALRLSALNHKEKYTVCICYYQTNISSETPDLVLCQDIINDHLKFADLRTNAKHGLVFITTQYSIIIVLLAILQGTLTIRKRRLAEIIRQHVTSTAHSIRTTLSSVSLVRHSSSSLEATAAEQQQHHHATTHEPTIEEEDQISLRMIGSPAIVISEPSSTIPNGAYSSDESEPFLRRIPSKNHVHFLLGPGEESDSDENNDDDDHKHENSHPDSTSSGTTKTAANTGPYGDQSDALLSMAHILDTNKPWSRHSQDPSIV